MKFILKVLTIICLASLVLKAKAEEETISLTFTQFYPKSPMKNFVSLTMRLWGEIKAARMDEKVLEKIRNQSHIFAHEVLFLNSTLDMVLLDSHQKAHECPECIDHLLHDFRYIIGVIYSLNNGYSEVMEQFDGDDVMTTKFVLGSIIAKIQKLLEEYQVPPPMYAFHSRETIPRLVPAIMEPVAPIA